MIPEKYKLKNTIKFPTSVIIGGLNRLGLEIADSLVEQGGYVIIVDTYTQDTENKLSAFDNNSLVSFLDYSAIPHLDEDVRRLDYVFYFQHESDDLNKKISTTEFLNLSNYLDSALNLAKKFNAKFLLTTSIKAHQLVLSKQDINLDYGYTTGTARHTVYTEMELQKYAESLAMEYFEKEKLDARIVRLGELIGDGMDFRNETAFTTIITDAVTNKQIRLSKDGLDNEWYVNILDAAYGIIKAQFSRITAGEIYSITYDTPFTNLSIAYKIQEYDTDAREIIFVEEKDNLPPLKLYKPAPNLSTIGWTPRVNIEKSIKQSLAAAKINLMERSTSGKSTNPNNNLVDKIKGFLAIAESDSPIENDAGAVSRLIAERKRQEELRKKSIEMANFTSKTKNKKQRTFSEQVEDAFWSFFRTIGSSVNIFKNKSPLQITSIILVGVLFAFIYFNYVSPAVALTRNVLVLYPEIDKLKSDLSKGDFKSLNSTLDTVIFHFEDTKNIVQRFQGTASLLALELQYRELVKNLDAYGVFLDGAKNLSIGMEPFSEYLNALQNNTITRAATDSYLSLSSSGEDYSNLLNQINSLSPFVEDGVSKIQLSSESIASINYDLIPGFIAQTITPINQSIISVADQTKNSSASRHIPNLLGAEGAKTYLVLLLDSSRPMPLGGSIGAYALISLNNGSIVEATVQSVDDTIFLFDALSSEDLEKINARRFSFVPKSELSIEALASVKDVEQLKPIMEKVIKSTFNRPVDGLVVVNTDALGQTLNLVSNISNQFATIGDVEFRNSNILPSLQLATNQSDNVVQRNALLAQLFANLVNKSVDVLKSNPSELVSAIDNAATARDVVVTMPNMEYQDYISSRDFMQKSALNTSLPIDLSLSILDPKYVGSDRLPSITTALESTLQSDFTVDNTLSIKFPSLASTAEVSLCLSANISDSVIEVDQIPTERIVKTSVNLQKCTNIMTISETQVVFRWKTGQLGRLTIDGLREIDYGILKIRGANNTLDVKASIDPTLKIAEFVPSVGQIDNSFVFTSQPKNDSFVKIVVGK